MSSRCVIQLASIQFWKSYVYPLALTFGKLLLENFKLIFTITLLGCPLFVVVVVVMFPPLHGSIAHTISQLPNHIRREKL